MLNRLNTFSAHGLREMVDGYLDFVLISLLRLVWLQSASPGYIFCREFLWVFHFCLR